MDNDSLYPPKPFLEKEQQRSGHIAVTVFSIVLFAMVFLFFFDHQVLFMIELLAVLLFHELGHLLMMKRFGYRNVRMLFIPLMGAFVHGSKDEYRQKESILVILAGPLPGIAVGVAFWLIGMQQNIVWMGHVAVLSFFLNVINLVPLIPMDGGRLLNALFFQRMELFQLIFAFCSSMAMIVIGFLLGSYILMVFGFLMGIQVRGMHRKYLVHKSLRDSNVGYTTTYENLSDQAYHFIRKEVLEHTPGLRRFLEQSEGEDNSAIVAGEVNNMLEAPHERDAGLGYRLFIVFVWIASMIGPFLLLLNAEAAYIARLYNGI